MLLPFVEDAALDAYGTDAFTLIELLVIIVIIAVLSAIIFPVFSQSREKARQAACMSNERPRPERQTGPVPICGSGPVKDRLW